MSKTQKILSSILVLAILAFGLGVAAKPAQAATCTYYHTVKPGENLFRIGLIYNVTWTYLAKLNNLTNPSKIYSGQKLCVSVSQAWVIPTFSIISIEKDKSVTIMTYNFPAKDTFDVLMGAYGTKGINGIKVGTLYTDKGGSLKITYNIPEALLGSKRIAIRLQSPTSKYFAYNWFWNTTTDTSSGTSGKPVVIPTFSISAVEKNSSVTIITKNFPPNIVFDVRMGKYGTKGVNGIKVGTLNSGEGGTLKATFSIPEALHGSYKIAIRTENLKTGYFSYNWFYNNTTP